MIRWMMAAAFASVAMAGGAQAQPVPVNLAPLDTNTVTTGGTAVTAVNHYNRLKGGWLNNPSTATTSLCIDEQDNEAATTTPGGNVTCVVPGQTYLLAPSGNSVSVVSSDSNHVFSGWAWR